MASIKRVRWLIGGLGVCAMQYTAAQQICAAGDNFLPADEILPSRVTEAPASPLPDNEIELTFRGTLSADDETATVTDSVSLRYRDQVITTEALSYNLTDETAEINGRVTYSDPDVTVFGENASWDKKTGIARFGRAGFELPNRPARGSVAGIIINEPERTLTVESATFTTCPADQTAWELMARSIVLDVDKGVGTARGVKLRFKNVPVFALPYFTFPLNDERKSGFLTPDVSERDRTGLYIAAPYYFNLAPNYDLVVEPRYMSKRGVQIANHFRYLTPAATGEFRFEWLPNDDETHTTRRYTGLQHESHFGDGWQIVVDAEQVSDDAYFEDLGANPSTTSQTNLDRYLDIAYYARNWSLLTRLQSYQTIDMLIADADRPYERAPQILFKGDVTRSLVAFDSSAELVNFERNVGTTGWRLDTTQELSLRFARSGMYLTPALAVRETSYWLDDTPAMADDRLRRGVPIASVDMGLVFERNKGNGEGFTQTLEPRMLYVSVPYVDQSQLPVFDTIVPDFNLVQLFRKYQYVGPDRISDSDLLSFGITTRLIDNASGGERLAATLGQTRYQDTQRVRLPGQALTGSDASDYVAEVSVSLRKTWNLDVGYQWNGETDQTARTETRLEYRPKSDRLFGFGYRYRRGLLEQSDISIVWPVTPRWRLIGRYSYSLLEEEPLDQFLGWEFDACCWRLRMVGRQYVSRTTGEKDNSISIQLELKGLSRSARSPEELLDRGILGYRSISRSSVQ